MKSSSSPLSYISWLMMFLFSLNLFGCQSSSEIGPSAQTSESITPLAPQNTSEYKKEKNQSSLESAIVGIITGDKCKLNPYSAGCFTLGLENVEQLSRHYLILDSTISPSQIEQRLMRIMDNVFEDGETQAPRYLDNGFKHLDREYRSKYKKSKIVQTKYYEDVSYLVFIKTGTSLVEVNGNDLSVDVRFNYEAIIDIEDDDLHNKKILTFDTNLLLNAQISVNNISHQYKEPKQTQNEKYKKAFNKALHKSFELLIDSFDDQIIYLDDAY